MSGRGPPYTRVYVGKLHYRTRERDLDDVFHKYGRIRSIDLKSGYAFIEFDDPRDAEDAVYYLHDTNLDGSRIIVEPAKGGRGAGSARGPPRRTPYRLIVENLSRGTSWQDLKDHMRQAGDVVYSDIFRDRDGRSKGYGAIEYSNRDNMEYALKKLDDSDLHGQRIYLREDKDNEFAEDAGRRRSRSRSPHRSRSRSPRRRSRSRSRSPRHKRSRSHSRSKSRSRSPHPEKEENERDERDVKEDDEDEKERETRREEEHPRSQSRSPVQEHVEEGSRGDDKEGSPRDRSPSPKRHRKEEEGDDE